MPCERRGAMVNAEGERIFIKLMTSDRKLEASREGSKCRRLPAASRACTSGLVGKRPGKQGTCFTVDV